MARGALSWEVTLSRLANELETPAMRRSLEAGGGGGGGGVQTEDTKSQDPEMNTSWASLRNNKSSVAGSCRQRERAAWGQIPGLGAVAKSAFYSTNGGP